MFLHKLSFLILLPCVFHEVINQNEILLKNFPETKKPLMFFMDFLEKFRNFHIIFHADFKTIHFVDKMLKYMNENSKNLTTSYHIFNHGVTYLDNEIFLRPNVSKILNVLLSEKRNFLNVLNSFEIIKYNDVVVYVYWSFESLNILKNEGNGILKITGNLLAVHLSKNIQNIYRVCYYCGKLSKKYILIYTTNSVKFSIKHSELYLLFPDNFKNFNHHLLHIIYVQYYPFVYCLKPPKQIRCKTRNIINCQNLNGIESNFIKTISEKLNFTYLIHTLNSSGTFFDMIIYVNETKADFAIGGISITEERMPFIHFAMQYNSEDYVFLYLLKLSFKEIFKKFIEPFQAFKVWLLYVLSYFLFGVVLNVYFCSRNGIDFSVFVNTFWILFHMPLEQPYSQTYLFTSQTRNSAMISLALWWWSTLIMVTLYKSSLLSAMVHPPNTEPDKLEDLVKAQYHIVGNIHYKDIIHEMLNVKDPLYAEALQNTIYAEGACDTLTKILNGNAAMIDELSEIMFELKTICKKQLKNISFDDFRVTRKAVRTSGHAWALQKGAPYIEAINYYISLILSGGFFQKWVSDETAKAAKTLFHRSRQVKDQTTKPLSFQRFTPLFLIYFAGHFIAFVSFIVEIIVYKFL